MAWRQRSGSVVCPSCNRLVGVRDPQCLSCGRRNPGLFGFAALLRGFGRDLGFIPLVTVCCCVFYALTLVIDPSGVRPMAFPFLTPSWRAVVTFGAAGAFPVGELGRWWTVLSAGWLHGGLLHLGFNLMAFRQLAPEIAAIYGPGRLMILYSLGSVGGFVLTTLVAWFLPFLPGMLAGAELTVGASAGLFGLIGAQFYASRRGAATMLGGQLMGWAVTMIVVGLISGGQIDNYAHLGGFLVGYLGGRVLDPLAPDRGDHIVFGLGLVVVSLLAVLVSVLTVLVP